MKININLRKEIEIIKKWLNEDYRIKNTITEIKSLLNGLKSRVEMTEFMNLRNENIICQTWTTEKISWEKNKTPPAKCRGLLDNTKRAKICIFKITEGEEKEDWKSIWKNNGEKLQIWWETSNTYIYRFKKSRKAQVGETQWNPYWDTS